MNKKIIKGTSTFPGIAIGKILYYHKDEFKMRQHHSNCERELGEFHRARRVVKEEIYEIWKNQPKEALNDKTIESYRMQLELLMSGSFIRAVENVITEENTSAANAVNITKDELTRTFRGLKNPEIKRRLENIKKISHRLTNILGERLPKINLGDEPIILVAESLSPTELMEMEKDKILAIVVRKGSVDSHSSIMAKTMGVPALVEIDTTYEWDECQAIVDGYTGTLYVNPGKELLKEYERRSLADLEEKKELLKLKDEKDITVDGRQMDVYANTVNLEDLEAVLESGASGIGLLRSEFQYLGRSTYPRESELFKVYKKVAEKMGDKPVVIRTVDLGADKQTEYLGIPRETNPIMGNRGIRLCLDRKTMFKAQLRAIYRASAFGNIAIMFPMITSEKEIEEIEALIEEVKTNLRKREIEFKDIRKGIMIETPAAVMISRELASRVDFLSIGTNDLTQYALAMDRQNVLLKDKYDTHHPAVLRMVKMVVDAGHQENCRVCICGEIAGDTSLTETFLEMGVDSLSVVPAYILKVRKAIRQADLSEK